jgi:hypothetical protein
MEAPSPVQLVGTIKCFRELSAVNPGELAQTPSDRDRLATAPIRRTTEKCPSHKCGWGLPTISTVFGARFALQWLLLFEASELKPIIKRLIALQDCLRAYPLPHRCH